MKYYKHLALASIFLMIGCTASRNITSEWQGKNIDEATASLGAPSGSFPRTDGGTTYTWTKDDNCKLHLVANPENIITSGTQDACKLVDFSVGAGYLHW